MWQVRGAVGHVACLRGGGWCGMSARTLGGAGCGREACQWCLVSRCRLRLFMKSGWGLRAVHVWRAVGMRAWLSAVVGMRGWLSAVGERAHGWMEHHLAKLALKG